MKALRFDCVRDEGSGCDGMTVFESHGDMKFSCGWLSPKDSTEECDVATYLDRDNVKELVAYLSDWLVKPFQGPW